MALTRITKGVIKPNENYDTHNINSTGIVTAIGLDVNGNADVSGSLSVGGVLTYEDVTSIDSVGIITARTGLVSPYADIDDFVSVGSNIHLGNAGVVTATSFVGSGAALTGIDATAVKDSGGNVKIQAQASGAVYTGIHTFNSDLDVDGHTNLDNVSVAGVTTFADTIRVGTGVTVETNGQATYAGIVTATNFVKADGTSLGASELNELSDAKTSSHNVFVGASAGYSLGSANYNTGVGKQSLYTINNGDRNTALGWNALGRVASSTNNVAVGDDAGFLYTGSNLTAIGSQAFKSGTGSGNTVIGHRAFMGSSTGTNNVVVGKDAALGMTSGDENVHIGYQAGGNASSGDKNVSIGYQAHQFRTTQSSGTAVGYRACRGSANGNDGFGYLACGGGHNSSPNLSGYYNIALGSWSMTNIQGGLRNTSVGWYAGKDVNDNDDNVFVGTHAGQSVNSGNKNTLVGCDAGFSDNVGNVLTSGNNNILLGYRAMPTAASVSNEVTIGDTNISHLRVPGIGVSFSEGGAVITGVCTATSFAGGQLNLNSNSFPTIEMTTSSTPSIRALNGDFQLRAPGFDLKNQNGHFGLEYTGSAIKLYQGASSPTVRLETTNAGVTVTGTVSATAFSGDGSALTGLSGVSVANQADNRLITATGTTDALNGEANLTFDGTNLDLGSSKKIRIGDSQESEIYYSGSGLKIHSDNSNSQIELQSDKNFNFKYVTSGGFHFTGAGQQILSMYGGSGGGIYFRHNNTQYLKLEGGNFTYENGTTVTHASHVYIPDSIIHVGDTNTKIRFPAADTITAETGGSERLRIDSSGTLGVNLTTPKTTRGIHISKGSSDGGIGNSYSLVNEYLHFGYSEHNSSGDKGLFTMGFGYVAGGTPATNSPAYLGYRETSTSGYTNGALIFATRHVTTDTAPTERFRIASTGQVLIGETTETGMSSYDLGMKNGRVIRHRNAAGNAWINTFGLDSSNNIKIGWGGSPNEIHFGISGIGEVAKFNTSGAFVPASNDSYDLGSSSYKWRNVYTTDLHLSNEGKTNDVDGTWGDWTLQEGQNNIFMINNRTGKKFAITMREVS